MKNIVGLVLILLFVNYFAYSIKPLLNKVFIYSSTKISGQIWHDLNGNGIQEDKEPFIKEIEVSLFDFSGKQIHKTIKTDISGKYKFKDIPFGNYYLQLSTTKFGNKKLLSRSLIDSKDINSDNTGKITTPSFALFPENGQINISLGIYLYVSIGDFVWEDLNGNGIQDAGEPGIPDSKVKLEKVSDGSIWIVNTDVDGYYLFDDTYQLEPEEYFLNFSTNPGFYIVAQDAGADDIDSDPDPTTGNTINFTLVSDENSIIWDAGMYKPPSIGDYTWRDGNSDGIQDNAEYPIDNISIELYTSNGTLIDATVSDANGFYEFSDNPDIIPGDYYLQFDIPATFLLTLQDAGADDVDSDPDPNTGLTQTYTFASSEVVDYIDAGYYVEPPEDCEGETYGECEDAEVLCALEDLNGFCATMSDDMTWDPIVGCGNGFWYQNPAWFAFVAGAEDVSLIIHATNCSQTNNNIGIQWGIYDDCDYENPIVLQCPCIADNLDNIEVNMTGLEIGHTYYLFIDGCVGTICTFWIEIVYGGNVPEVQGPSDIVCDDNFPDCSDICVGADVLFSLEDIFNADTYVWFTNGVQTSVTEDPDTLIHFDSVGIYQICAYGQNDCDIADDEELCITVEVTHLDPEDLGTIDVCENVLENGYVPDDWEGPALYEEGKDSVILTTDPLSCEYWQKIEIIKLPRDTVTIDTTGCLGEDIIIEGETFSSDVEDYEILVPDGAPNGCDKIVFVTTHFITLDGHLEANCSGEGNGMVKINFFIEQILPEENTSMEVAWQRNGESITDNDLTDPLDIIVSEDGIYTISINVTYDGVTCTFNEFAPITIYIDDFLPETPEAFDWPLSNCSNNEDFLIYEIINTDPNYDYIWSWPDDVLFGEVSNDETYLTINWSGSSGGEVCVFAFDPECGSSDTICQNVTIIPAPNSPFSIQDTICLLSQDTIIYTGIASDTATYTWNFSGGTDNSNSGINDQGPHYISWNSAGIKIISLTVDEDGCESETTTNTVVVVEPPQQPIVLCSSTATSITFEWDPVNGSSGTSVEVVSGQNGALDSTTFTVNGLTPLEEVRIVLHIQTNGYCPEINSDTITCYALDCPIINVEAFPQDTNICMDGNAQAFNLTYLISPDSGGMISWSGNGIVDTLTGLFDPDSAGIEDHTVILRYFKDNCPYTAKAYIHIYEQPTADFEISSDTICILDNLTINYFGNAPFGNPTWNFDDGKVLSGSGLDQHIVKWNTPGIKNISLQVENNSCNSSLTTNTVFVQDTLDDIFISCEPSTDSIVFSWNLDEIAKSYKIYINESFVDSSKINTYTVNGLVPGDSVNISLVAINNGICEDKIKTDYCFAITCPDYQIDINPGIDTICLDETSNPIVFNANVTGGDGTGTYEWSGNGIDAVTGIFDPKIAGPGSHIIYMRYKEICSVDTSFTIEVIERPVTQFSIEKDKICIKDSAVIHFFNDNPINTYYDWSLEGGNVTIINDSTFFLKWNSPGTYTISLKTSNSICDADTKSLTVQVDPELIAPVIDCNSTTSSIEINWIDTDCAESYNVYIDNVPVVNTSDTKYNLTDLNPKSAVNITIEAVSSCACDNVSNTITCETEPCPDINIDIAGLPNNICVSDLGLINLNADITGDNSGVLTWNGQGIDNSGNINLSGFAPGEYIYSLKYTIQNCYYQTTDTINIIPLPNYEIIYNDPLCYGEENGKIVITDNNNYEYYLDGTKFDNSVFTELEAGTYEITVKDIYGCEKVETITLNDPDPMEPVISGPDFIKENSSGSYSINNVEKFTINNTIWYFENGDTICSGVQCNTIDIKIDKDRVLCVDVVNDNGCLATNCIDLRYIENVDIDIPNIFTPDDDGINDIFYIKSDNTVEFIKELRIFNRWGELVFKKENFPPNDASYGWDGLYKGRRVNPGVFVYYAIFKIKDRDDIKMAGDITIVR